MGFEDDVSQGLATNAGFAADIPKRDAVVEAFKVRLSQLYDTRITELASQHGRFRLSLHSAQWLVFGWSS